MRVRLSFDTHGQARITYGACTVVVSTIVSDSDADSERDKVIDDDVEVVSVVVPVKDCVPNVIDLVLVGLTE
jgi:hypothetical protein